MVAKFPDNAVLLHYQQIALLQSKGIIIDDKEYAVRVLSSVNYYRFSEYFRHMSAEELLLRRPTFEQIYQLYRFDADLRYTLLRLIEKTEISLRAKISYVMATEHGAESYLDSRNFKSKSAHDGFMREFKTQVRRYKKRRIKHREDGSEIAVWEAVEIFTFGMLTKFYANMLERDRRAIANAFSTEPASLDSRLDALVELRNACAHYDRVFNRSFEHTPKLPKRYKGVAGGRLFAVIIAIKTLCGESRAWAEFTARLEELLARYDYVDVRDMGFPEEWRELLGSVSG